MIDNIFSSRILYSLSLQKISQESLCPVIRPDNFIVVLQYKKHRKLQMRAQKQIKNILILEKHN